MASKWISTLARLWTPSASLCSLHLHPLAHLELLTSTACSWSGYTVCRFGSYIVILIHRYIDENEDVVFPRLLYSDLRCFQTCGQHSMVLPWFSPELLCPCVLFPSTPRCTSRPLHWSSQLWDLSTVGFWSDIFQWLRETKFHFSDVGVKVPPSCMLHGIVGENPPVTTAAYIEMGGKYSYCDDINAPGDWMHVCLVQSEVGQSS